MIETLVGFEIMLILGEALSHGMEGVSIMCKALYRSFIKESRQVQSQVVDE